MQERQRMSAWIWLRYLDVQAERVRREMHHGFAVPFGTEMQEADRDQLQALQIGSLIELFHTVITRNA